ncbi:MAG: PH domain-containing protein [Candidatus Falkowbacteria bacterium]
MENINKQYARLGRKTLNLLILKRSANLLFFLCLLLLIFISWNFIPSEYLPIANWAVTSLTALFLLYGLTIFFLGWLEYKHYKIFITDETVVIYRGLFSKEEIGLPFRRIKQADIKRSLIDQVFGVSSIYLTIIGEEDNVAKNVIALPLIEKKLAQEIQDIILKKAEVEEININPNNK